MPGRPMLHNSRLRRLICLTRRHSATCLAWIDAFSLGAPGAGAALARREWQNSASNAGLRLGAPAVQGVWNRLGSRVSAWSAQAGGSAGPGVSNRVRTVPRSQPCRTRRKRRQRAGSSSFRSPIRPGRGYCASGHGGAGCEGGAERTALPPRLRTYGCRVRSRQEAASCPAQLSIHSGVRGLLVPTERTDMVPQRCPAVAVRSALRFSGSLAFPLRLHARSLQQHFHAQPQERTENEIREVYREATPVSASEYLPRLPKIGKSSSR